MHIFIKWWLSSHFLLLNWFEDERVLSGLLFNLYLECLNLFCLKYIHVQREKYSTYLEYVFQFTQDQNACKYWMKDYRCGSVHAQIPKYEVKNMLTSYTVLMYVQLKRLLLLNHCSLETTPKMMLPQFLQSQPVQVEGYLLSSPHKPGLPSLFS